MAVDLLSWPELKDAEADLARAHVDQVEAARKVRCAPHGQLGARRTALQEAVQRSLQAELRLARLRCSIRRTGTE